MEGLGEWIRDHAEAVYETEAGLPRELFNGSSTRRGKTVYLIAYDTPRDELVVKGVSGNKVARVTHLRSGQELTWRFSGGYPDRRCRDWMFIRTPAACMDPHATVIKIEFEGDSVSIQNPSGGTMTWR
jgi:alpha-L-fucosidase